MTRPSDHPRDRPSQSSLAAVALHPKSNVLPMPQTSPPDNDDRRREVPRPLRIHDASARAPADLIEHFACPEQVGGIDALARGPVHSAVDYRGRSGGGATLRALRNPTRVDMIGACSHALDAPASRLRRVALGRLVPTEPNAQGKQVSELCSDAHEPTAPGPIPVREDHATSADVEVVAKLIASRAERVLEPEKLWAEANDEEKDARRSDARWFLASTIFKRGGG